MSRATPVVPSVSLRELAQFNPAAPVLNQGEEVAFIPMAAVSERGTVTEPEFVTVAELKSGYSYMQPGDVLVAKITPCFENNKIAVAAFDRCHGFGSTEFHVIRPDTMTLDRRYVFHFLRQDEIRRAGEQRMTGSAGQRRVPRQFLEELTIPLPPLNEQRRIAAILDQADELRRMCCNALKKVGNLKQSLLYRITDAEEFGLQERLLGDLISEFRYGTSEKATTTGHPVLRIPNVIGDAIDTSDLKYVDLKANEAEKLKLRLGDLLFVRTNGNREYVGRSAVIPATLGRDEGLSPEDFVYASYLIRARPRTDITEPIYLQACLTSVKGRRALLGKAKTSAGQFNINIEGLRSILVKLPPLPQQRQFVDETRALDQLTAQHRAHLQKLDALFASLQHRAFRGEL